MTAIPYFDAHCDTITRFKSLRRCDSTHLDLERLSAYAPSAQVTAIFAPPGKDTEADFQRLVARSKPRRKRARLRWSWRWRAPRCWAAALRAC